MGKLAKLFNQGEDKDRSTLWTTPWAWRDEDGLYVGWNGQVWLYRSMPLAPIAGEWEDEPAQIAIGRQLSQALTELGETSKEGLPGLASTADHREIHIVAIQWEAEPRPPEGVNGPLRDYLTETLDFLIPSKALLVGVRLRPEGQVKGTSVIEGLKRTITSTLGESVPDVESFTRDRDNIDTILRRSGGRRPRRDELRQLESWYNLGRGPDATIVEYRDRLEVADHTTIELAAVLSFEQSVHFAPNYQWAYAAETHQDGIRMMSVRAELEPATSARRRARQSQRKIKNQIDEEMATGDIERPEYSDTFQLAAAVEEHFIGSSEPLLSRASIVMARRSQETVETYIDYLRNHLDIECRPLDNRQLPALDETLPCSTKRVNPFLQELSIGMIAYAGLGGFSNLGDRKGVYVGVAHPNYTPTYLDLLGAPARNKPPSMAIFGDPGSGKAQPLDAPVLTPHGWTTMGNITAGDQVVAVDGTATTVQAVYPQGVRPIHAVRFDDGSIVEADAEHLWNVTDENGCQHTMSTQDLLTAGLRTSNGTHRWTIPMTAPVQHHPTPVPADPYVFGTTLGSRVHRDRVVMHDDSTATGHMPEPAREQVQRDRHGNSPQQPGPTDDQTQTATVPHTSEVTARMHIPRPYLHGSIDQRIALLQGLCDTAGHIETGTVTITCPDMTLARDIRELVESLGGTAPTTTTSSCTRRRLPNLVHELRVTVPEHVNPFRDPHLQQLWAQQPTVRPERHIESIDYVGHKPAQCILVDHPEHLYLTGHHVVTHNTYLSQMVAYQATLSGVPTIFINPKGFDTLAPLVTLCGGRLVSMSRMETEGGAFDPFRYAPTPEMAAEILTNHILSVLTGFTEQEELNLAYGLRQAAEKGARCAAQALQGVADKSIVERVVQQVKTSPTFALGFGLMPQEPFDVDRRLTLIEFDRKLDLPDPNKDAATHTRSERIALAAIRLVTRASIEILARARGGVMIVDEAWTFLSHPAGLAALQQLGREGRSLNILPVFCTQRVADLLGSDMEGYLSRVFVMALREEREAKAALRLCGIEPTEGRLQWLAQAGPQSGEGGGEARWAAALHRDLDNRHAAVLVGPVPQQVHQAITTNPVERERIRRTLAAQQDLTTHAAPPPPPQTRPQT